MDTLLLKIITPKKIVLEKEILSITLPTEEGEITILPHHANLFSILKEGIIKIKYNQEEDYFAIGGGYLETDGHEVNVLVSRAYGQDEIDEISFSKTIFLGVIIFKSKVSIKIDLIDLIFNWQKNVILYPPIRRASLIRNLYNCHSWLRPGIYIILTAFFIKV